MSQKTPKRKITYVRPAYYSPSDVAVILQVSLQTVRRWIREGQLPAYKIGGEDSRIVRIPREALEAFIQNGMYHTNANVPTSEKE